MSGDARKYGPDEMDARYGLNARTVTKRRRRTSTPDQPMGPTKRRSTVLTEAEEAMVIEFRRHTLLPLDDELGCLRESPKLKRSAFQLPSATLHLAYAS